MATISRPEVAVIPLCERPAWKALQKHYAEIQNLHLRQLFADNAQRAEPVSYTHLIVAPAFAGKIPRRAATVPMVMR